MNVWKSPSIPNLEMNEIWRHEMWNMRYGSTNMYSCNFLRISVICWEDTSPAELDLSSMHWLSSSLLSSSINLPLANLRAQNNIQNHQRSNTQ